MTSVFLLFQHQQVSQQRHLAGVSPFWSQTPVGAISAPSWATRGGPTSTRPAGAQSRSFSEHGNRAHSPPLLFLLTLTISVSRSVISSLGTNPCPSSSGNCVFLRNSSMSSGQSRLSSGSHVFSALGGRRGRGVDSLIQLRQTFANMEAHRLTHSVKPFHFRKYSTLPFTTRRRIILSTANSWTTAVSSVFLCLAVCFFLILPSTRSTQIMSANILQSFVT